MQDRDTDRTLTIKVSAKGGISFFGMSAEEMNTKTSMVMHDAIENIQEIPVTIALRVLYRPQEDEFTISAYRGPGYLRWPSRIDRVSQHQQILLCLMHGRTW